MSYLIQGMGWLVYLSLYSYAFLLMVCSWLCYWSVLELYRVFRCVPLHLFVSCQKSTATCIAVLHSMARIRRWAEKLKVPSEPGLSNAQLMLTNEDLRPGEIRTVTIG